MKRTILFLAVVLLLISFTTAALQSQGIPGDDQDSPSSPGTEEGSPPSLPSKGPPSEGPPQRPHYMACDDCILSLTVKFLSIMALPVAFALFWRRSTRAIWACIPIAFGAASINFLVQIPLGEVLEGYLIHYLGNPLNPGLDLPYYITQGSVLGLVREGIRWLMLLPLAATVRSWRDGVLFGVAYSIAVIPLALGQEMHFYITAGELYTYWEIATVMNNLYPWVNNFAFPWDSGGSVLHLAWELGPPLVVYNVGTSLAVLISVQRRQVWPFLIAILFVVIATVADSLVFNIYPDTPWIERYYWNLISYLRGLLKFVAMLLPLWFTLHFRNRF